MQHLSKSILFFFCVLYSAHGFTPLILSRIGENQGGLEGVMFEPFTGDEFGTGSANIGDFNGDGIEDIAIGAPRNNDAGQQAGAVYILFMAQDFTVDSFQLISATQGNIPNGTFDLFDLFGFAVSSVGDFNGDGITDLAVGAPGDDDGGMDRGAVYILFLNPNATVNSFQKISDLEGGFSPPIGTRADSDLFGFSVANIGNFNDDNITDLAVGAIFDDEDTMDAGAIYILFLTMEGSVLSFQKISSRGMLSSVIGTNDLFGLSASSLGDFNGDGITDLVVGAPGDDDGGTDRGAVYVLFLNANATLNSFQKISSQGDLSDDLLSNGDQFGVGLATSEDFNGDGIIDFVIGAPGDNDGQPDSGAVYIMLMNADATISSIRKISNTAGPNFPLEIPASFQFGSSISFFSSPFGDPLPLFVVTAPARFFPGSILYVLGFSICGDGEIGRGEICDDGNIADGDGCSSSCQVELGFECDSVVLPSVCSVICGDGFILNGFETCDDGNPNGGDGCSETCQLEIGFTCNTCSPVCGDGIIVADEECDDENILSGDGCSSLCSQESNDLSSSAIGGIVVGGVVFLCLIILIAVAIGFFILSKIKKQKPLVNLEVLSDNIPILKDVEIGKVIGEGAFGEVYQAKWNNIDVALKSTKGEDLQDFQNELQIMLDLRHPNILSFYGLYFKDEYHPLIVTELMNRGDLLHLLQTEGDITKQQLIDLCQQVCFGMEYLHSQNILHRDLACRNLLVSSKNDDNSNLTIKVADFGLSRQTADYYTVSSKKIPIRWTAPEVIEFGKASKASDVWSFGVVFWEIFSRGAIPYAGHSQQEVIQLVKKGRKLTPPPSMPQEISQLMSKCFALKPENRIQFHTISEGLKSFCVSTGSSLVSPTDFQTGVETRTMTFTPSSQTIYNPINVANNLVENVEDSFMTPIDFDSLQKQLEKTIQQRDKLKEKNRLLKKENQKLASKLIQ